MSRKPPARPDNETVSPDYDQYSLRLRELTNWSTLLSRFRGSELPVVCLTITALYAISKVETPLPVQLLLIGGIIGLGVIRALRPEDSDGTSPTQPVNRQIEPRHAGRDSATPRVPS